MTRPTILLTGFDPFDGAASNPSWSAVAEVAANWTGEADLHTACLPTVFADSQKRIRELIAHHKPDIVIAVGLAQGRTAITPDNRGHQPRDLPVVADAPDAYFTTLPVKAMVRALRAAAIPAALSYSAGTFVCNHVFYTLMHELQTQYPSSKGGFIHIPASPVEVADGSSPTLPTSMVAEALRIAIAACLDPIDDMDLETGSIA
jgi:pyroglutamyl-peptidase